MAGVEASLGPIPGLGEQRDAILAEIGYDAGQIARLRTAGVC
jgi:crotonobetainyl-CoA:carnitine CoA-transferase CaiB-like acyl-CoA transferase